jgi:hypothetical protein
MKDRGSRRRSVEKSLLLEQYYVIPLLECVCVEIIILSATQINFVKPSPAIGAHQGNGYGVE